MRFDDIAAKHWPWTDDDIDYVFKCLTKQRPLESSRGTENIDHFMRAAYSKIMAILKPVQHLVGQDPFMNLVYKTAEEVALDKLEEFFRYVRTSYDPDKYRGTKCPVRNYIFVITCRGARRRAARERTRIEREQKFVAIQIANQATQRQAEEEIAHLKSRIENCINHNQMSSIHKEALSLVYLQGLSSAEAAEKSNCSSGAFRVRLHRARQKFESLGSEGGAT